jgi:hypothetical protein
MKDVSNGERQNLARLARRVSRCNRRRIHVAKSTATAYFPLKLIVGTRAVNYSEEAGPASQDGGEHTAHGSHCAYGPDLVEHKPHDNEREQNADKTVSGRSELRRGAKALECDDVKGEGKLNPYIAKSRPAGDPCREERDRTDDDHERSDGIRLGKDEGSSSQPQNQATNSGPQQAEREPLLHGTSGR